MLHEVNEYAVLCPGQGAQVVGMGRDVAESRPACMSLFERATEILGNDFQRIVFEGPQEELTASNNAQPGLMVASMVCYTAMRELAPQAITPAAAGLSSGEWTALHLAGVVSFEDAVRVLEARGRYMQEACEAYPGTMSSIIGLDADQVKQIAEESGVETANFNSDQQIVLSGDVEGIEVAEEKAREAQAKKVVRLEVAGAFHSRLMEPAAERLSAYLEDIPLHPPSFPVMCNATGLPHSDDGPSIRQSMVHQITEPVRWVDNVRWMRSQGMEQFVECGPGRTLAGLLKRIDKGARVHTIQDTSSLETFAEQA